jgi:hypothetical protein
MLVFRTEQAALLQDRHDVFDERIKAFGNADTEDETVGGAILEPMLRDIGNFLRAADEAAARGCEAERGLRLMRSEWLR